MMMGDLGARACTRTGCHSNECNMYEGGVLYTGLPYSKLFSYDGNLRIVEHHTKIKTKKSFYLNRFNVTILSCTNI